MCVHICTYMDKHVHFFIKVMCAHALVCVCVGKKITLGRPITFETGSLNSLKLSN